jgi:hypothetical protein
MFYLLLIKRKIKKEEEEKQPGDSFPKTDMPRLQCHAMIFWLLGGIESCFKGQSLNFVCTKCVGIYI